MAITISILALLLAVALAAVLGAVAGRALVRRELGPIIRNAAASAGRANKAAATIDEIAGEWPRVLERLKQAEAVSRKAGFNAQVAKQKAADSIRLQNELERAVVTASASQ